MKYIYLLARLLFAAAASAGSISITKAYSHPTPAPGVPGVGFMTIVNASNHDDRLLAVSSAAAGSVEIHQSVIEKGVMRMRAITDGVSVPAGESVSLAPAGLHLMLFDLKQPLRLGDQLALSLKFERAGVIDVVLSVQARGEPAADSHHHH